MHEGREIRPLGERAFRPISVCHGKLKGHKLWGKSSVSLWSLLRFSFPVSLWRWHLRQPLTRFCNLWVTISISLLQLSSLEAL